MTDAERDQLPPKPKDSRYYSFDFWRGAACLMLLCYHATFYADHVLELRDVSTWSLGSWAVRLIGWLWIGVPIFFVVSGYCIAGSIDSLRRKPHSLGSYFLRRARRIYPPLWIMVALAVALSLIFRTVDVLASECHQLPQPLEFSFWNWIGNVTASEAWLHQLTGAERPSYLMSNTWTLCYEEQFYAVAGIILLCSAKRFFTAAGVVAVLTVIARHACRAAGIEVGGFFFDGHWLLFSAGILVYHCINYGTRRSTALACGTLCLGMLYAFLDRRGQTSHFERHLDEYLFVACGFAIALIACRRWDRWFAGLKLLRPVVACGNMSYSVYLTHYLLVVVMACLFAHWGVHADHWVALCVVPTCLLLSLPPAWLFHKYVERRFMNQPA